MQHIKTKITIRMELKNCTSVLFVKDAKAARDFYVNVLGMTVVSDFGGMNFMFKEGFAIWQPMDTNVIPTMLGADNIHNANHASRFELCFETGNLDEVYQAVKAENVKFLHEVNEELWGQRTIRFYDPDGHLLEVGEAMLVFLKRIYEEEKTAEGVAQRTFMDVELVRQFLNL